MTLNHTFRKFLLQSTKTEFLLLDFIKEIHLPFKIPTPDKSIKVAVTGLSRSGKTVFLTSLINQLIANDKLDYLNDKIGRPFMARLLPPDSVYIRFDYYNKLKALRNSNPKWPKSTKAVSKTTIQLEFKSEFAFLENQIINLELIDYPGEWLMDLSMLNLSFAKWSKQMLDLTTDDKRYGFAKNWLSMLDEFDLYGYESNHEAEAVLADGYSEYLKNLYYHDYSFIQPGRFVEPGDMQDDPLLIFCPLPPPNQKVIDQESIYNHFQKRYEAYVKEVVKKLYLEHFQQFDSQLILIDLLKTLNGGYKIFEDMHLALQHILKTFTYGHNNLISQLFGLKIDRVIFAATKADHIPQNQHEAYRSLLDEMISDIKKDLDVKHIDTEVTIFSAVKSTQFVRAKIDGVEVDCVKGTVEGEDEPSIHYPGILKDHYKSKDFWPHANFDYVNFKPISFPPRDNSGVEHIRMDRLIYTLLKDHV